MKTLEHHPVEHLSDLPDDAVHLCCPTCALNDGLYWSQPLDIPTNQYYYCPLCHAEWCLPAPTENRSGRLFILGALTWLTFQFALMLAVMLGWTLVLRDNYGYTEDAALGYGALYGTLTWIGSTFLTFPAMWAGQDAARWVRGYLWGAAL
jgi:hypothetical protein